MQPRIGDTIGTVGHLWPPQSAVVTLGIQAAQRFGRWPCLLRIPSPYWRITHSMAYVGALEPAFVQAAAAQGVVTVATASDLVSHADWMLSMTTPVGCWVRYSSIARREHYISRPTFSTFGEPWKRRVFECACWWWIGRRYDSGQLFGILADVLGEVAPKKYSRLLDASPWRTVCSGAVASAYEAVRRQAICAHYEHGGVVPEWITAEYGEWPDNGGPTWWPRILRGLHLERTAPGHLCLEPWFETVKG